MAKKKNKIYRAGAYKRLSQDEGRGEISNSIINQTELIKDCGKKHSDTEIVAEYDDDGYSGTNFDRPGFLRMMEDIKAKKIDCVIVKDDCVIIEPTQKDLENQGFVAGSICF